MGDFKGDYAEWEDLYRHHEVEKMPWYYPGLDPDFEAAFDRLGIRQGKVLDLCTGPGTQAIAMAERGFSVTASDIADSAVSKACEKARERGLDITFRQNDILDNKLAETFEFILDRGCYHLFPRKVRQKYPPTVSALLDHRGYLLLKCFSHKEKSREGPYRIAPDEIREAFKPLFDIVSIEDSVFRNADGSREFKALFCIMQKQ